MPSDGPSTFGVHLGDSLEQRVRDWAYARDISISAWIREAVKEKLARDGDPDPHDVKLPSERRGDEGEEGPR